MLLALRLQYSFVAALRFWCKIPESGSVWAVRCPLGGAAVIVGDSDVTLVIDQGGFIKQNIGFEERTMRPQNRAPTGLGAYSLGKGSAEWWTLMTKSPAGFRT